MDILQDIIPSIITIVATVLGVSLIMWRNQTRLFDKIDHLENTINLKLKATTEAHHAIESRVQHLEEFKEFVYRDGILKALKGEA